MDWLHGTVKSVFKRLDASVKARLTNKKRGKPCVTATPSSKSQRVSSPDKIHSSSVRRQCGMFGGRGGYLSRSSCGGLSAKEDLEPFMSRNMYSLYERVAVSPEPGCEFGVVLP
ncbi:uncharacterized protein LOC101854293 [Aplysia californica]|uniref:Uncharacterized protein LOC101854293 n=1 Tax=Aplysia californica TaxID=6500 RepID=A0ABM0K7A6_APLCA|nr:uncharacterized protein LOC101854293 [Aplysia californica]